MHVRVCVCMLYIYKYYDNIYIYVEIPQLQRTGTLFALAGAHESR